MQYKHPFDAINHQYYHLQAVEVDEVYIVAGHKGQSDRGTSASEKPPVLGLVQRSDELVLRILDRVDLILYGLDYFQGRPYLHRGCSPKCVSRKESRDEIRQFTGR